MQSAPHEPGAGVSQPVGDESGAGPRPDTFARVLVVDDMADTRRLVSTALTRGGFEVVQAENGQVALAMVDEQRPDLVLLDINMPGISGLDVMTELRVRHGIPVILLTGRDEESDRVVGLELGADDYIVKPFYVKELVARARAAVRRAKAAAPPPEPAAPAAAQVLEFGPLVIHLAEREVHLAGDLVETTPKEFDLLAYLAASPRTVFTRQQLLDAVWGSSTEWQDPATVTEHVRRLRRKIEADSENPTWLLTVRGVGYRFMPPA
ncbi:MAG: response regulator transcription factor [Actinobacteria bacterium]|nr:response regulator transcription factor [Actinomycetota bacterium]